MKAAFPSSILCLALAGACATPTPPKPPSAAASDDPGDQGLLPEYEAALRAAGIPPETIQCNGRQVWSSTVGPDSERGTDDILRAVEATAGASLPAAGGEARTALEKEVRQLVFWRLIRVVLLGGNHNNLGAVAVRGLTTDAGKPVLLYRSGITPTPAAPGACFRSLVEEGGVRHAVNLYAGAIPTKDLDDAERATVEGAGGSYFLGRTVDPGAASWRSAMRKDPGKIRESMQTVARIINDHVLRPGGAKPKGNVLVHCGGGMHRTGMVVGVLQRCINGVGPDVIERQYKQHTAYRGPDETGGFEQENLDFVREFDCSLLKQP